MHAAKIILDKMKTYFIAVFVLAIFKITAITTRCDKGNACDIVHMTLK